MTFFFILIIGILCLLVLGLVYWAPREPADLSLAAPKPIGDDLDHYLQDAESAYSDIKPSLEKRIIWANDAKEKTLLSVVYLHGFSAASEEIRPVPDLVSNALGSNLFFTRLQGHGREDKALAEGTVAGWMADLQEAILIGERLGERVLLISTSTGGTLAAVAALNPKLSQKLAGSVFVSPNFGILDSRARFLTWPLARYWLPVFAGKTRRFDPRSAAHAATCSLVYPSVAVLPVGALVKQVMQLDFARAKIPSLFLYSSKDQVVQADKILQVMHAWGGQSTGQEIHLGQQDDESFHVLAGHVLSPSQTKPVADIILNWAQSV
jgi:pimeloyl-ACP methyl ester carboxylesterase